MFKTYDSESIQIFDTIHNSPKNRKYYEDTILTEDGRTVGQLRVKLTELVRGHIIIQKLIIPEKGEPYLLLKTTDVLLTQRLTTLAAQIQERS